MNEALATPGARLKAERERRGLSAQKAADEMHLDAWVIDALESGDYARIGASVYAKGHLKKYVSLLGLPMEEMLGDFETKMVPKLAQTQKTPLGSSIDTPPIYNASAGQVFGLLALLAVVGGVLWWRPWQQRNPHSTVVSQPASVASAAAADSLAEADPEAMARATTAPDAASPAPEAPPKAMTAVVRPPAPAGPIKTVAVTGAAPAAAGTEGPAANVPGAGRAQLRLSFTADSWVDVRDAQGNRVFVGNGSANTVKSIAGQAPMHVYLRAGSGVQLEINGRAVAIGPQFFARDAARFEAGADGVLRRDSRRDQTSRPIS
jgi:cytoskeleton protein RodZ